MQLSARAAVTGSGEQSRGGIAKGGQRRGRQGREIVPAGGETAGLPPSAGSPVGRVEHDPIELQPFGTTASVQLSMRGHLSMRLKIVCT